MRILFVMLFTLLAGCTNSRKENYEILDNSTFKVYTARGSGTAFVFQGRTISVGHVCAGNPTLSAKHKGRLYTLTVLRIHPVYDLCELSGGPKIEGITHMAFLPPSRLSTLYGAGSAYGQPVSFTEGIVQGSAVARFPTPHCSSDPGVHTMCLRVYVALGSTMPAYPGNSGSPVI